MSRKQHVGILVLIATLGYFVDVYDLVLFMIVREPSLKALGFEGEALTRQGIYLLNLQMSGMLIGGIFWGILGDKKGRLSVLFGTILLYSVANILNGMINSIGQYYLFRFIAGFGLAGELGIGITLIAEVMSKEKRGLGTTLVSAVGIAGAVVGFLVADKFDWRVAYYVGGGMGLALLLLRVSVVESGMFANAKEKEVERGHFFQFLRSGRNFIKYLKCIMVGIPVWFTIGIFVALATELAAELGVVGNVKGSAAVMYHYVGASTGALLTGLLSQLLRSRKKALLISLFSLAVMLLVLLLSRGVDSTTFYLLLMLLGIPNGYWSVFMASTSEQFGTNIRATVTTSAPNIVRGAIVLISTAFTFLATDEDLGFILAAAILAVFVIGSAIIATILTPDTFDKNLDYIEV